VETEQGVAYTRQGNFRLDAAGRLVTQQGRTVLGLSGPIQLAPGAPRIDAQGRVFEAGAAQPQAQLRIVDFAPGAVLERLGDGLVRIQGDPQPVPAATELRQGFLENSNVEPLREMLQLLQSVRHMETLQKVALGYDEMLASSIRRLGEGT
jgi:flagellar basal-body rod protein FlgG